MRSDVTPFIWFMVAVMFAVLWRSHDKAVYLILAVIFAILAKRSYSATKKARSIS